MKLLGLLGLLLPAINSEVLQYTASGKGINSLSFTFRDPDSTSDGSKVGTGPSNPSLMTDGDVTTGEYLQFSGPKYTWGGDPGIVPDTVGMTGTFEASVLNPGAGYVYWNINKAQVVFEGCMDEDAVGSAYYYDLSGAKKSLTSTTTMEGETVYITANIPTEGVNTNGAIGFNVETNIYCEAQIRIVEFVLEGTTIATPEPTDSPTQKPTANPTQKPTGNPTTTSSPTMSPTRDCTGSIAWGDPHFYQFDVNAQDFMLNFQGEGTYYYFFPCDKTLFPLWPFFVLAHHTTCYWQGTRKACIDKVKVVLNTKPKPWIFEFTTWDMDITVGSDISGYKDSDFSYLSSSKTLKRLTKKDPVIINYNDGGDPVQYGTVKIFAEDNQLVVQLHNVNFKGYPRTCQKGEGFGTECGEYVCENEVMDIRTADTWLIMSCPTCFRNILCGIMGLYTSGDCKVNELKDPTHKCYNILRDLDGKVYTPPTSDTQFALFAATWEQSVVDAKLKAAGLGPDTTFVKEHAPMDLSKMTIVAEKDPRAINIRDASFYGGNCTNNWERIKEVNQTCKANTVDKYAKCCKEIGICSILWEACVEDLCACTKEYGDVQISESECLDKIIHDSMNTTCSYDGLYPTATPTGAPTGVPTGLVAGLPQGQKAQDLIWLYLVFVVLFVVIAVAAYLYYKKKSGGKAYVDDAEQPSGPQTATTATYD